jgi:hypothetical protein
LQPLPDAGVTGDHKVVLAVFLLALHEAVLLDERRGLLGQLDPAARVLGDLGGPLRDVGTDREIRLQRAEIEFPRIEPLAY